MNSLRLIEDGSRDPFYNMAADEAIAVSVGEGRSPPTLRLYGWMPYAVSLGYFQEVKEEVDLWFCENHGIKVVRRITGGGAVFHGGGELTYSFIVPANEPAISQDIQESYKEICQPIIVALRRLGADAKFRAVNDIEVGGRKVSGNAQTRRGGAVLQHGTILVSLDHSLLRSLRVKPSKLEGKGALNVSQRVTTLEEVLGRSVEITSLGREITDAFSAHFNVPVERARVSAGEEGYIPPLVQKYSSEDWLWRR